MRTLAIYSDIFADKGKNTKVLDKNVARRNQIARMSDKVKFTKEHYEEFEVCQILWFFSFPKQIKPQINPLTKN